jgi:hypothetical protein
MTVAVTSECLLRYILKGEKKTYAITLGDLAVREIPSANLIG